MNNINSVQKNFLEKKRSTIPDLMVRWDEERGVASVLEGSLLPGKKISNLNEIISTVLREYGVLLGPSDVLDNYKVVKVGKTSDQSHRAKGYQIFQKLPVYGATILVFANEEKGVYRIQSSFWRDVNVTAQRRLEVPDVKSILYKRLSSDVNASRFEDTWKKEEKPDRAAISRFPIIEMPKLYLYPVEGDFHPVYDIVAYQPSSWSGVDGRERHAIGKVNLMLDAATGHLLWEESTQEGMSYTNQNGDGLSTLQDASNNYLTRNLQIVQQGTGNFFMLNRQNTPHIRTYDAGGTETGLVNKLKGDADLSQDSDGHWNSTTTSTVTANRTAAQQPEVDGHFLAEDAWNFYDALGWDGFDDGGWGAHCPVRVVAHIGMDANAYFSYYSEWDSNLNAYKYHGYIAFYDGLVSGTNVVYDFMAGDPIIFGHEYQHAITFFGASKSTGEPGHLYGNDWLGAIREGYSDAFACLRRGLWITPAFWRDGVLRTGASFTRNDCNGNTVTANRQPFRRIEYPRSTNTHWGDWYCDHYDDSTTTLTTPCFSRKYFASTLISHLAYLVGQGGLHQRTSRAAQLIPVKGVGLNRTAKIFLYALTNYFDGIPTNLAGPTLIKAGQFLLDAAKQVGGSERCCEYVMMRRALYAVGLYPFNESYVKQTYGGEACMLPWTIDWRFSQPYLGMPALWYNSPDLFINNNGAAVYEGEIGRENKVFARVRNIGDQSLSKIKVRFYFRRCGTNLPSSMTNWETCQDMAGNDCVLDISSLAAGAMNITDPNNPPANQAVLWYLDPSFVTADVDHFCLRAVIECSAANNNNDCPNQAQSNIRHVEVDSGDSLTIAFEAHNWLDEPIPLDIRVEHTLPKGFSLRYLGKTAMKQTILKYGQTNVVKYGLKVSKRVIGKLQPPYDGRLTAKVKGKIDGKLTGELTNLQPLKSLPIPSKSPSRILVEGMISGTVLEHGTIDGHFTGKLDLKNGTIIGEALCSLSYFKGRFNSNVTLKIEGCLDPMRAINFTQYVKGRPVGGITVKIKPPRIKGLCDPKNWL